jgi:hypothetical protein
VTPKQPRHVGQTDLTRALRAWCFNPTLMSPLLIPNSRRGSSFAYCAFKVSLTSHQLSCAYLSTIGFSLLLPSKHDLHPPSLHCIIQLSVPAFALDFPYTMLHGPNFGGAAPYSCNIHRIAIIRVCLGLLHQHGCYTMNYGVSCLHWQ